MAEVFRLIDLNEALTIRSSRNVIPFAGGSDLMIKYRTWRGVAPDFKNDVLFIGHIGELKKICIENNILKIGSACTLSQILNDEKVPIYIKLPIFKMASPAIRNIGTIGGNICNSSPAGDTLPMLYALGAYLIIQSKSSLRSVLISDFITGPGKNKLKEDEILTEIEIPLKDYNTYYYKKIGTRGANCLSKVSFFAVAKSDAFSVHEVRMAFGSVAPIVVRSYDAEMLLEGILKSQIKGVYNDVKKYYEELIRPITDQRSTENYRREASFLILKDFLIKTTVTEN